MFRILIFGGTTEGRELVEFCSSNKIWADVSVATDYGARLLPESDMIKIMTGKLDCEQIKILLVKNQYSMVVDATHPYAVLATHNIKSACISTNTTYFRLLRDEQSIVSGTVVQDIDELITLLNQSSKTVLSTLGSKELSKLLSMNNYAKRLWVRVLQADGIIEYCKSLGIDENKIILGKGPFSVEENIEHIKFCNAEILITKESGKTGGYPEKIQAADECGLQCITVKRPLETGFPTEKIQKIIIEKSGDCK